MEVQIDIEFEQLVKIARKLPARQWTKLKLEVEKSNAYGGVNSDLEELLLTAPTFTKKQLDEIAKTRKAINQWRTK
ncbi:MAG: hypothetical protein ABI729_05125 [Chitinophagales bacterium]